MIKKHRATHTAAHLLRMRFVHECPGRSPNSGLFFVQHFLEESASVVFVVSYAAQSTHDGILSLAPLRKLNTALKETARQTGVHLGTTSSSYSSCQRSLNNQQEPTRNCKSANKRQPTKRNIYLCLKSLYEVWY